MASLTLPRSGYVPKPRVAASATLGNDGFIQSTATRLRPQWQSWGSGESASPCRNPFRVEKSIAPNPGLKQPWALRRNRFAVEPIWMKLKSPLEILGSELFSNFLHSDAQSFLIHVYNDSITEYFLTCHDCQHYIPTR